MGDPFVSAAQSHCPTTARLHLSQDVILLLSKCPQKRPEIEKMVSQNRKPFEQMQRSRNGQVLDRSLA